MFLSQLILDDHQTEVRKDLSNVHNLHRRIMSAFPDEERQQPRADWKVLYRYEPESNQLLVQSSLEPDWQRLPTGYLQTPAAVKSLQPILQNLTEGRQLRFRLWANPTKRDAQTRKILALYRADDQEEWLKRKGQNYGFSVQYLQVHNRPKILGIKPRSTAPIRLSVVNFQGVLKIENNEQFKTALMTGIGRGKSYGCGLLSLAPLG
ncbi:type I-E CRISPR-associated protein Cas6/Cse3/CasE [Synechococcus elongatus]|uniref:type I-E CRISPR-associated protein Cas6/Cse3/CasE n=1 Tax=Synechococcus elongatus TaxID=32046 RepID=UPI0030CBB795